MNNEIKQNLLTMDEIYMVNFRNYKVTKVFVVLTDKEKNNIGKKITFTWRELSM